MLEKFKQPKKISGEDLDSITRTDRIIDDMAEDERRSATGQQPATYYEGNSVTYTTESNPFELDNEDVVPASGIVGAEAGATQSTDEHILRAIGKTGLV